MNVLHIIHNLEVAGAQTIVSHLALHANEGNSKAIVCAWKRGGEIRAELEGAGVPVYVHEPSKLLRVLPWLQAIVLKHKIDVIHGHMSDGAFWGGLLSKRTGLPFVLTYHSNRLLSLSYTRNSLRGRLRFWMLKSGAKRAQFNIACGEGVRERILEELSIPPAEVPVVRNGVPLASNADAEAAASERLARTGGIRVLVVGRLDKIKGQHLLIEAAPLVLAKYPDSEFTFVGDGPCLEEHRALAARLGVEANVRFTGTQRDVNQYFRAADVYASTSEYEGISLSVVEAMGWLLPVVATDVVGNRDLVREGETGLLYPFGDARKLANAIIRTREERDSTERMAREARKQVAAEFSVERMVADYEALYARASEATS